jgi:hypothetical protein
MRCSPSAAWRHILLNGHYTFQSDGKMIDLDALVAGLELGWGVEHQWNG